MLCHGGGIGSCRADLGVSLLKSSIASSRQRETTTGEADRLSRDPTFRAGTEARMGPVVERMREQFPADLRLVERFGPMTRPTR